ncbi:PQQ-dependent dehydrogenase, methanol/ethanol family [Altererythrobacter sp.]|uniref:PQQ-dependent dehydrogenase, methanol/ethanol family n=1 Tax=Altererythrobacter sp. TaxID=1872480 RepID=UPI003D068B3E
MKRFATLVLAALLAACSGGADPAPPQQEVAGSNWTNPGGDAGKTHHSSLTKIDKDNVGSLGLAWQAELGTNRVLEATPVVLDGVMYTSGVAGRAYAFDAATGEELWRFEPEVDMQVNRTVCCDMANRGVAVAKGKVYVAALDAQLYALDARTGEVVWKADTVEDPKRGINSTGAPEVAGSVVVIGNGGAEYDVRGYVSAYDLDSGELRWRFHTVPRDPRLGRQDHPDLQKAVETWDPDSRWDIGGGGTPWDAINYDPLTGYVIVGTGNGGPYHTAKRSPKGGEQLYLSSLVALNARTGRVAWYYQETPGDNWDFTATQPMILTTMDIGGEKDRPVLIHAPKNGFLYIFDRRSGELLSAKAIVRQNWNKGINPRTGKPIPNPDGADYSTGPKIVFPATPGARNWHPGSYDPASGLYFAPVQDMGNLMFMTPGQKPLRSKAINNDAALVFSPDIEAALPTLPPPMQQAVRALPAFKEVLKKPYSSELRAIDPVSGETRWAVSMDGWQDRGGVLTTASGLLFQGNLAGQLRVFDMKDGKLLKRIETGTSILAAPMTYEVDGVQYVAVMAAWGGGGYPYVPRYSAAYKRGNQGRLLVFKLGGTDVPIPAELPVLEVAPEPPAQAPGVSPETIAHGQQLFFSVGCALCHSNQHRSITPDLRRMQPGTHEAFDQIVLDGLLSANGMPRWDDILTKGDAAAIHAWLIDTQARTRADELEKQKRGISLDTPSLAILSNY